MWVIIEEKNSEGSCRWKNTPTVVEKPSLPEFSINFNSVTGTLEGAEAASEDCPKSFKPKHSNLLVPRSFTHVCRLPQATKTTALARPLTTVAVSLSTVSPVAKRWNCEKTNRTKVCTPNPNCPLLLLPQHWSAPESMTAQLWRWPRDKERTKSPDETPACSKATQDLWQSAGASPDTVGMMFVTFTGRDLSILVPSPIWPLLLLPQHFNTQERN